MISIIGTAGRSKTDFLTKDIYKKMVKKTKEIIEKVFNKDPENVFLVSGGAAWSDHIVINLYLENYITTGRLYLPAEWDFNNKRYLEVDKYNYGKHSNYYHKLFSKEVGKNTLEELDFSIKKGLEIDIQNLGFKNRNLKIAESDYLIAFSWGKTYPSSPGTLDTWNKSKSTNKIHVSLHDL